MAEIELAAAVGTVEESVQRAFVPYVLLSASAAFSHLMNGLVSSSTMGACVFFVMIQSASSLSVVLWVL